MATEVKDKVATLEALKLVKDNAENTLQAKTESLEAITSATESDVIPLYVVAEGTSKKITVKEFIDSLDISAQKLELYVHTCAGASVTCTNGAAVLENTGSCKFNLPDSGIWTVTCSMNGVSVSKTMEISSDPRTDIYLMILDTISVTTPPTKTLYDIGDTVDPAGAVVTATYMDGTTEVVTDSCVWDSTLLTGSTTVATVTFEHLGVSRSATTPITVRTLSSISVSTAPDKTTYNYGETFDKTGLLIAATMSDGTVKIVSDYTYSPTGALGVNDTTITISYSDGENTKTCTQAITIIDDLKSIAITTKPTTTTYLAGETFSSSGMVVKATYASGTTKQVSGWTTSPTGALSASNTSITVSYTENGVTKTTTQSITVKAISNTLNSNDWDVISMVSAKNKGSNYWSVGDRKAVAISGTVGTLSVSGTYYVYILGFNHNSSREGSGIHFGGFKTAASGGTDICLVDSYYDNSSTDGTKYFNMNHSSNTNSGGWKSCDLRYDVLGSTNSKGANAGTTTATSPVSGTLMAALPSALRAVMKPITKYTDNTGGGSDTASYVTATVDYLPLLAEYEIFGSRSYANSAEHNYQAQYSYYSAGNSKVKYKHSSTSSSASWWERSPCYNDGGYFCRVDTDGDAHHRGASWSYGVAPAFMV